ncbi:MULTISPECIES: HIT domain-containing protein [Hungatella]|uniref:HIT domain-containing protein n=1 Tax=Hungatella TaxID=1649459 RepID=UPI0011DCDB33
MPKTHVTNILDCDEKLLNKVFLTVKKVSNHLVDNFEYNGVDLLCANGEAAGQSLPHFYIHIIPRRNGDGVGEQGERPEFPDAAKNIMDVYQELRI